MLFDCSFVSLSRTEVAVWLINELLIYLKACRNPVLIDISMIMIMLICDVV